MLFMLFPNFFKSEGHSNPKQKKIFEKVKKAEKHQHLKNSRYNEGVSPEKRSEIRKNLDGKFRYARRGIPFQLAILLLALGFLVFLAYGFYFMQNSNRPISLLMNRKPAKDQPVENDYQKYSRLGEAAYHNGEHQKAIAHFQKAFKADPNGPRGIVGLAKTFGDLCMLGYQNCEPARHWVTMAITRNLAPEDMKTYYEFLWGVVEE